MIDPSTDRSSRSNRSSPHSPPTRPAAPPRRPRRRPSRRVGGGWCGRRSRVWRCVRSRCRAPAPRSHGRTRPGRGCGGGDTPRGGSGRTRAGRTRSGQRISTHRGSVRDAGSRGTDSPGDHQDYSNPMITCRSVPLPATTRRRLYCRSVGAVVVLTHLTGFQQVALAEPAVRGAEVALYLVTGYLLFLPLVGGEAGPHSGRGAAVPLPVRRARAGDGRGHVHRRRAHAHQPPARPRVRRRAPRGGDRRHWRTRTSRAR